MKISISAFSFLLTTFCAFAQTPVLFTLQSLTGTVNNRSILVQPDRVQNPLVFGTNLVPMFDFTLQPVNGQVLTNLAPWGYTITVDGWPRSAHIIVPDTTNTVNAATLINTNQFAPLQITWSTPVASGPGILISNTNGTNQLSVDPTVVVTNNATGVTLGGSFTGLLAGTAATATTAQSVPGSGVTGTLSASVLPPSVVTNNSAGGILPLKTKLGFVATRCRFNEALNTGSFYLLSRTTHVARDNISQIQLCFQNSDASGVIHGTNILSASIEFPSNNFTQLTFSGNAYTTSTVPIIKSDLVTLTMPIPDGAVFWCRIWSTNAAGVYVTQFGDAALDQSSAYTTGGVDKTMLPGPMAGFNTGGQTPLAIIGYTAKPSVLVIGDSRSHGLYDYPDSAGSLDGCRGAEKYFERKYAGCLIGIPAESIAGFMAISTNQTYFTNYATTVLFELGINSIATGQFFLGQYSNAVSLFSTLPVIGCTLEPYTTSSDNWTTLSGQTPTSNESYRVALNNALRSGQIPGIYSCLDLAAPVESSLNSGLWTVNGSPNGTNALTWDGLHCVSKGYNAEASSIPDIFAATPTLGVNGGFVNGSLNVQGSVTASNFTGNGAGLTNFYFSISGGCDGGITASTVEYTVPVNSVISLALGSALLHRIAASYPFTSSGMVTNINLVPLDQYNGNGLISGTNMVLRLYTNTPGGTTYALATTVVMFGNSTLYESNFPIAVPFIKGQRMFQTVSNNSTGSTTLGISTALSGIKTQ